MDFEFDNDPVKSHDLENSITMPITQVSYEKPASNSALIQALQKFVEKLKPNLIVEGSCRVMVEKYLRQFFNQNIQFESFTSVD